MVVEAENGLTKISPYKPFVYVILYPQGFEHENSKNP